MKRTIRLALLLAVPVYLSACTPPPQTRSIPATSGTLTWAIGSQTEDIGLSRVENDLTDGILTIKAWGDEAILDPSGRPRVPVVLFGRLPVDRVLVANDAGEMGMIATIPNARVEGREPVPVLKLIARDVSGVSESWSCETEARRQIRCESVHAMPWQSTVAPPKAAFKAFLGFN